MPNGNGTHPDIKVRVNIDYFLSLHPADSSSDTDPYFIIELRAGMDGSWQDWKADTSGYWLDTIELFNPCSTTFDIPDDADSIQFTIWAIDLDADDDDTLDYCPVSGYSAYRHTAGIRDLPVHYRCDGSDDGVIYENDCILEYTADLVATSKRETYLNEKAIPSRTPLALLSPSLWNKARTITDK